MKTANELLTTLRDGGILPAAQINYGWTDRLQPPYLDVTDFRGSTIYDSGGPAFRQCAFTLHHYHTSQDSAETQADNFNGLLEGLQATRFGFTCWQDEYSIVQEDLHFYHVQVAYSVFESGRPPNG